jgi:hypothetical protein
VELYLSVPAVPPSPVRRITPPTEDVERPVY